MLGDFWKKALSLAVLIAVITAGIAVYHLFFHPLAGFSGRRDEYRSGDAIPAWRPGDEVVRNHEARRHERGRLSDACTRITIE